MMQDSTCNQFAILEILSDLIKTFKRMLSLVQNVSQLMQAEETYLSQLRQLLEIVNNNEQIIQKIDFVLPRDQLIESSFTRFLNRLTELLLSVSKPLSTYNGSNLIQKFYAKAEQSLKSQKSQRNAGKMFSELFTLVKRFCRATEGVLNGDPIEYDGIFYEKPAIVKANQGTARENVQIQNPKKQSNYNKVMNILNAYYSNISCLDLDFPSFKALYFQTRSQTQKQLTSQITERNTFVTKAITYYSKRFQDYLRRKEKVHIRKNKPYFLQGRHKPLSLHTCEHLSFVQNSQLKNQNQASQYETITPPLNNDQKHEIQFIKKKQSQQTKQSGNTSNEISGSNKKKTGYLVKNVYMTFGKPISRIQKQAQTSINIHNTVFPRAFQPSPYYLDLQKERASLRTRERFSKLSPVKLSPVDQHNLKRDLMMSEIQLEQANILGFGQRGSVIHRHNWQKKKQNDFKTIRVSSFARKLPSQFKLREKERTCQKLKRPNPENQTTL